MKSHAMEAGGVVLKADLVRAGDVLLSLGPDRSSLAIAAATLGSFSHAAVWLPMSKTTGPSSILTGQILLTLVESEDYGVGDTPATYGTYVLPSGERGRCIPFKNVKRGLLLRHPQIDTIPPHAAQQAADELREKEFHLGYSELERLAAAVRWPRFLQSHVAAFLRSQDTRNRALVPGAFCSELVAKYYILLGLPLGNDLQTPANTSPNDLFRSVLSVCLETC